ncbi:hypothetical protein HQ531_05230 [bacterium]|nr:hypothetical protein [bacterium]
MKQIILLIAVISGVAFAQVNEEVVYLKDGSIIHGRIIEYAPDRHIKIQSGPNVFVYQLDQIDRITREPMTELRSDLSNATWAAQFGIGTPRSINLIGVTKDFKLGEKSSIFITAGLGINLIGVGYARYKNYNGNGLVFSGSIGHNGAGFSLNSSVTRQWRVSNHGFFSFGQMASSFKSDEKGDGDEKEVSDGSFLFPTISFDCRF